MSKNYSFLLALVVTVTGCMPDSLTKYRVDPIVPTAVPTVAAGTTNFSTLEYFQVTNQTSGGNYSLFVDQASTTSSAYTCAIEKSEITAVQTDISANPSTSSGVIGTDADVTCYLNADELELFHKGLSLKLQVPAGICEYLAYDHYSFFQYQYRNSTAENVQTVATVYVSDDGCSSLPTNIPATTALCVGDYSGNNPAGPNCDDGSITNITNTVHMTGAGGNPNPCTITGATVVTTTTTECGGKIGSCLNGPAVDNQDKSATTNWPRQMVVNASAGYEKQWDFATPISKGHGSNLYLANYTNRCSTSNLVNRYSDELGGVCSSGLYTTQVTCEDNGFVWSPNTNNLASFASDFSKATGIGQRDLMYDPRKGPNPFYTFSCLDQDFEVIGRIRVMVRDWNVRFSKTADDTVLHYTNDGTKMDRGGSEPGGITSYNDFADWDDFAKSGGTCSNGISLTQATCSVAGAVWTMSNQGMCARTALVASGTCTAAGYTWLGRCIDSTITTSASCTGVQTPVWMPTNCIDFTYRNQADCVAVADRYWTGTNCVDTTQTTYALCNAASMTWAGGCQSDVAPLFSFPGNSL
ncbi:MAG: hypothetical protein ACOYL6_01430 [Bacteriovoracaceae bacterium]